MKRFFSSLKGHNTNITDFENNNPKLWQKIFKKSEVASKRKIFSVFVNSSILDLVEFLALSLLSYTATLAFITNRPARKTRHCGGSKKFRGQYSVYKSNLSWHEVWWTQRDIKGYLRYKTITSQNVSSEALVKNFLIYRKVMFCSQDIQVFVFPTIHYFTKSVTSW